jgi:hypothetical protein
LEGVVGPLAAQTAGGEPAELPIKLSNQDFRRFSMLGERAFQWRRIRDNRPPIYRYRRS